MTKELRVKQYADKLERDLRNNRFIQIGTWSVIFVLVIALCYASLRGNVIVVGDNLVSQGEGNYQMNSAAVVEIRVDGHARLLYERFFSFDYNNVVAQKTKALYLGDKCIEDTYKTLTRIGFYQDVAKQFYTVKSMVDSIGITGKDGRFVAHCFGRMVLTNSVYYEERELDIVVTMIENIPLKDLNPFGLDVVKLELTSNEVVDSKTLAQ